MTHHYPPLTAESARRLTIDAQPWLSCDDCFDLVDRYIEALLADPRPAMTAMHAHLSACSACYDEARSLLLLVAAEIDIDPTAALAQLAG